MKRLPRHRIPHSMQTGHRAARVARACDLFQKEDATFRFTANACVVIVGVRFVGFDADPAELLSELDVFLSQSSRRETTDTAPCTAGAP